MTQIKKTLSFNEAQYNNKVKTLQDAADNIQAFVSEFHSMDLFKLTNMEDIAKLAESPESFIKSRLVQMLPEESFAIAGVKLKRTAIMDQLEVPDLRKLIRLGLIVRGARDQDTHHQHPHYLAERSFLMLEEGRVVISPRELQVLRERFSVIATTPEQAKMYGLYVSAAEALTQLNAALKQASEKKIFFADYSEMGKYFSFDKETGSITISELFLEQNKWSLFK